MTDPPPANETPTGEITRRILHTVHPLMAEAFHLAAVPFWFRQSLFASMRQKADGRDSGLIERLNVYPFVYRTHDVGLLAEEPAYALRAEPRLAILEEWISQEPDAFRQAHRRALGYWQAHPDANSFAQQQNLLYHKFFVQPGEAVVDLITLFRDYTTSRLLAAAQRILETAAEAHALHRLLPPSDNDIPPGLGDLLTYLDIRLDQLRGHWADRTGDLNALRFRTDLSPDLRPFVVRARGHALAQAGHYVDAIHEFKEAIELLKRLTDNPFTGPIRSAELANTYLALGDAYLAFAGSLVRPQPVQSRARSWWRQIGSISQLIISLPLIIYLSCSLRRPIWHISMGPTLAGMDWMVARLYTDGVKAYEQAQRLLAAQTSTEAGLVAREKLASSYLLLGDAGSAAALLSAIQPEAVQSMSLYRSAVIDVKLAQAYLQQGQPDKTISLLTDAIPVVEIYEDQDLSPQAHSLLAEAHLALNDPDKAMDEFDHAIQGYRQLDRWGAATALVERMEAWCAAHRLPPLADKAQQIADSLARRRYPVEYRHPVWKSVQYGLLLGLVILLFFIPLLAVQINLSFKLEPNIRFVAQPILGGTGPAAPEIEGMVTVGGIENLGSVYVPSAAVILHGMLAFAGYLIFSLLLGLGLIAFTSIRLLEQQTQRAQVDLHHDQLVQGEGSAQRNLPLDQVQRIITANVRLWSSFRADFSTFTVITPQARVVVRGATHWYHSLYDRIRRFAPQAQTISYDYWLRRSAGFAVYVMATVLLLLLAAAIRWPIWPIDQPLPWLYYRPIDLYPYLILGVALPPLYWFIVRPLRIMRYQSPYSAWPWWLMGFGALLLIVQLVTRFRPLLTAANLYPPLLTACLFLFPALFIWRVREAGDSIYARTTRIAALLIGVAITVLGMTVVGREVWAYHQLAVGNWHYRQVVSGREDLLDEALAAYDRAVDIGSRPVWGFSYDPASPVGLRPPDTLTWAVAQQNRTTLLAQVGQYADAKADYLQWPDVLKQSVKAQAFLGLVRQAAGTSGDTPAAMQSDPADFNSATFNFDLAIGALEAAPSRTRRAITPGQPSLAQLYLWRALSHHVGERLSDAQHDYAAALAIGELDNLERQRALTGLGWITYSQGATENAEALFRQASAANPADPAPVLGLGYTLYQQQRYEDALAEAQRVVEINPNDPAGYILSGAAYWRLGSSFAQSADRCAAYEASYTQFTTAADLIRAQMDQPQRLAFLYRTQGNLLWLLQTAPWRCREGRLASLNAAVDRYDQAVTLMQQELDRRPDSRPELEMILADYTHMRARLRFAYWVVGIPGRDAQRRETPLSEWLTPILSDMQTALALRPDDAVSSLVDYRPNWFIRAIILPVVFGDALVFVQNNDLPNAQERYRAGMAFAQLLHDDLQPVQEALDALQAVANAFPGLQVAPIMDELETLLRQSGPAASTIFDRAHSDLSAGNVAAAVEMYRQGLARVQDADDITAAADALLAVAEGTPDAYDEVRSVYHTAFPSLAATADANGSAAASTKLAIMALMLDDFDSAGRWYNESIRRTALDQSQWSFLEAAGDDLERLWRTQGSRAQPLLDALELHQAFLLRQYPGLGDDGYHWRYRGWFKYCVGRAAFLVRDEAAAQAALASAIPDGERAASLGATEGDTQIETFLPEGGWGYYHVLRAQVYHEEGDLSAALTDLTAAVPLFQPDKDPTVPGAQVEAAFQAAAVAIALAEYDQAEMYYREAMQLADQHARRGASLSRLLQQAAATLQSLLSEHPGFTAGDAILAELNALQTQLVEE